MPGAFISVLPEKVQVAFFDGRFLELSRERWEEIKRDAWEDTWAALLQSRKGW